MVTRQLQDAVFALVTIGLLTTTITTALRFFVRLKIIKLTVLEDWLMLLACIGYVAYIAIGMAAIGAGVFGRNEEGDSQVKERINKIIFAMEAVYPPVIMCAKVSIIIQMIRLFYPIQGSNSWYAMMAFAWFNILWFTACLFGSIFQCSPIRKAWNSDKVQGTCVNYPAYTLILGVGNLIADIILLIVPAVRIWSLNMATRRKVIVAGMFTIGTIACVASLLRIVYGIKHFRDPEDIEPLIALALCTSWEIAAGVLCGNLVCLPKLVRHYSEKRSARGTYGPTQTTRSRTSRRTHESEIEGEFVRLEDASNFSSRT